MLDMQLRLFSLGAIPITLRSAYLKRSVSGQMHNDGGSPSALSNFSFLGLSRTINILVRRCLLALEWLHSRSAQGSLILNVLK